MMGWIGTMEVTFPHEELILLHGEWTHEGDFWCCDGRIFPDEWCRQVEE